MIELKAHIRHIANSPKGVPVSYDREWTTPYPCIIATLSVGYGDGYPRCLGSHNGKDATGRVRIRGKMYDLVSAESERERGRGRRGRQRETEGQ